LNQAAARALSARVLRVEVAVDQTTTLMADLGVFDPATQVVFINPVTTITAAYRNLRPATSVAKADGSVAAALAVSSLTATACQTTTGFNGPTVLSVSASSGGFNAYVKSVAQQIAQGQTPSLRSTLGVPQDFRDFFLETVSEIFGEALGGFPGAKPLAGWILGGIFTAPDETPGELQQIEKQLQDVASQLNQVLAGISQLSVQITNLEQALAASQALTNYQNDAATAQTWINGLCNMNKQLIVLANSDPTNKANQQFAQNLQAQIQAEAGNDLANMWSVLEGNGGIGTRSLINEWANAVGTALGAPRFANVSYLASAVPNLQYYQGAMLVGYNLQIELAHALEVQPQGSSDLPSALISQANADFEQNEDVLMRLVGQNQPIGSGPTGLYAAVLPPFFAAAMPPGGATSPNVYNADPTNAYNWSIDTRSGLLWMRSRSCDGSNFSNCNFAMYNQAGGLPSGAELTQPYISNINTTLNNSYPDELLALTAPSRAQWISLLSGLPLPPNYIPSNYLASIYFFGSPGQKPPAIPNYNRFWTSDIGREASGAQLFPAWDNWTVDTRFIGREPVYQTFSCCDPTQNLELVSAAPLTDPYHFLYRSHQDDFSRNVFTSGPALGVARGDATVTPLLNGKVLIAGGVGPNLTVLNSTERTTRPPTPSPPGLR
jgi:hypothetical protein